MKKAIFLGFIFPFCLFGMQYKGNGIFIDENKKLIILNGDENPIKTKLEGVLVVELNAFATENSGFWWHNYVAKEYTVEIQNTNIHTDYSVSCLLWFMNNKFKVILAPSSFISLTALSLFSEEVPRRSILDFQSLKTPRLPLAPGLNDMAKLVTAEMTLREKGYLID